MKRSSMPDELARDGLLPWFSSCAQPESCSLHASEGTLKLLACPADAEVPAAGVGGAAEACQVDELSSAPSSLRASAVLQGDGRMSPRKTPIAEEGGGSAGVRRNEL